MKKVIFGLIIVFLVISITEASELTNRQKLLLVGARSRIGDKYDASYYLNGYPPKGKSACVDILYFACKKAKIDLQKIVNKCIRDYPERFPEKRNDSAIDHRWVPNLFECFGWNYFTQKLTTKTDKKNLKYWEPGDFVIWSLCGDGIADHCGIISDKKTKDGIPKVIHQFPPKCKEEDVLKKWKIIGHFRI